MALALPAYAFANYALGHPESSAECRERIDQLIQIASKEWVRQRLEVPMDDDVAKLQRWNNHGVYLGHYCLMLAGYRLAGGDARYAERQQRIALCLKQGLQSNKSGIWIRSYPERAWLFDSLPCLLAVRLSDVQNGRNLDETAQLTAGHLRFRQSHADARAAGFTCTEIDCKTGGSLVGARGCDVAGTICFLSHLAPDYCQDLYRRFKKDFWLDVDDGSVKLSGFCEWPRGQTGGMDADSGPIVMNIGLAATGFGLGSSRFANDEAVHRSLLATIDKGTSIIDLGLDSAELLRWFNDPPHTKNNEAIPGNRKSQPALPKPILNLAISKDYHYRHLMADAVAFYCLTWRPWCDPAVGEGNTGVEPQSR